MSPLAWGLVHGAIGVVAVLAGCRVRVVLERWLAERNAREAAAQRTPLFGAAHVVTAVVGGKIVELYSDQPFTVDNLRHAEFALLAHLDAETTAEVMDALADAIAADAAADIDADLEALGGAA